MNKKLKFRVWYPTEKKFYVTSFEDAYFILGKNAWDVPYTIQQYTGLKDSTEKEIYEGDIIKDTWQQNHPYGYFPDESLWNMCNDVYVVKYEPPSFIFHRYSGAQTSVEEFKREVIGNIFENPELLKQ